MHLTTLRLTLLLIGTALFFVAALLAYQPERVASMMFVLFAAILGVVLADRKLGLLSWSAGVPIFYVVFFLALPLVNRLASGEDPSEDGRIAQALFVICTGLFAFVLGVLFMRLTRPPKPAYDLFGLLSLTVTPRLLLVLIVIGTASLLWSYAFGYFGLIAAAGNEANDAAGVVSAIGILLTVAHVLAWNSYFRNGKHLNLGILSTALMCIAGVLANSKGQLLAPFALIALCLWGTTNRFPYKLITLSLLMYVFVAFPFVTAARFAFPGGEDLGSRFELADAIVDYLLSNRWTADAAEFVALGSLGDRLLPYFSEIVHQAGNAVPFLNGRTIVQGFEGMVPRIFYPDKPDMSIGNWTGQLFGAVDARDYVTNLSPTFIGEFFMNFGMGGVVGGMFLVGVLAVLVDRYLIVDRRSWTMPIVVMYVGWQESFVGHTIVPFLKNCIVWVPLLLLTAYLLRSHSARRLPTARLADG